LIRDKGGGTRVARFSAGEKIKLLYVDEVSGDRALVEGEFSFQVNGDADESNFD